jgi:hypothetical protein
MRVERPLVDDLAARDLTSSGPIRACRSILRRVSRTAHASFVLDALEQALHDRRPLHRGGLVHHSDREMAGNAFGQSCCGSRRIGG